MAEVKKEGNGINKFFTNKLFKTTGKNKITDNLLVVAVIGVILIIAGTSFFSGNDSGDAKERLAVTDTISGNSSYDYIDVEKEVERLLSRMEGAGKVEIVITYESGREIIRATDIKKSESITEEKDSQGGTRKTEQTDYESKTVYDSSSAGGKPLIIKELYPSVKGVVIIADGAKSSLVRENLTRAVQVLLDIPIHKIKVFPSGK